MKYNILLPVTVFLIYAVAGYTNAQVYTDSKVIRKSFRVKPNTTLDITNKYGKVHLITWNKDSVRIEITQVIKTNREDKLGKISENITYDFTSTDYYVVAKTNFGSKYYSFFNEIKIITDAIFPSETQVMIDYLVMVPQQLDLKIDNRYGDIYADDLEGDITLFVSNGDLKINDIRGNANITVSMGDASLHSVPYGTLDITYSDISIEQAGKLTINTKLSTINIEKASEIKLNSKRDKLYINELDRLAGETYFSDIWIYKLNQECNFKTSYGNLNLEGISHEFSFIDLHSEYADMNMYFEKGSAYQLDITHKGTHLRLPGEISVVEEKVIDTDESLMMTTGYAGRREAEARLKINAVKGYINIIHK